MSHTPMLSTAVCAILRWKIAKCCEESNFLSQPPSKYLPRNCILDLVTPEAVANELGLVYAASTTEEQELIKWTCLKAPVALLITLHTKITRSPRELLLSLQLFREVGFDDGKLPWTSSSEFPSSAVKNARDPWVSYTWTRDEMEDSFVQTQWKFLVPFFASDTFEYKLQPTQILPFSLNPEEEAKEGSFGSVHHVIIHEAHTDLPCREVAVKVLKRHCRGDVTAAWSTEVRLLKSIRGFANPHLIHCMAAIERGNDRLLLFPWARGGSLREYWDDTSHAVPTASTIRELLVQLKGLANALRQLHNFGLEEGTNNQTDPDEQQGDGTKDVTEEYSAGTSIRHGDLKPENLLWFTENDGRRLTIADMGLAKRHSFATQERPKPTTTNSATILYEAPEAKTSLGKKARSRQYDIWSMGCILTEWIIWILYGNTELKRFYNHIRGPSPDPHKWVPYYDIKPTDEGARATLNPDVRRWLSHIRNTHPECQKDTAINAIMKLIEDKLLVAELSPRRGTLLSNSGGFQGASLSAQGGARYRATSIEFENAMHDMLNRATEHPPYLLMSTDSELATAPVPRERSQALLLPGPIHHNYQQATTNVSLQVPPTPSARLENWEFPVDNGFAKHVALRLGEASLNFHHSAPTFLCDRCAKLSFWDPGFYIVDNYDRLQQKSSSCQLCELLWHACSKLPEAGRPRAAVRFERVESIIKLIGVQSLPVLSILRNFESSYLVSNFQIGFPRLPKAGTSLFFNILEYWLQDCDNHQGCRVVGEARLPTRLIDVGTQQLPTLRLVETGEGISGDSRYIALSHRWGDTRKHRPFCTRLKDENGHDIESFRQAIPYQDVPQTFRDAIETTRRLGIRYLWIDSLCIIQGDGGDFNTEAKRMEDVFSCAYCVIAASRASNPHDGFLGDRPQRQFIAMPQEESSSVFLCETIDDFGRHVLDGALNQRGWVLQERALARRTIYFTEAQTYFECGKGVRCETLSKMQNSMAEFLGDARFPEKAMKENSRAIKIRYFQDLYRRYSQLEFSHIQDRPIAIAGLENRLRKAYWSTGAYGIFDDRPGHGLFHRSLLWQRSEDEVALKLIDFSFKPESAAPTWSWMAHEGGIDYLDPPFQQTEWEETEIEPPWTAAGSGESHNTHNLRVVARPFNVAGHMPGEVKFVYDNPGRERRSGENRAMCVVVAKERGNKPVSEKRHYVLVVAGSGVVSGDDKRTVFIRQGVGYMTGKYIGLGREDGLEAIVR
ncbi:Putative protein kinase domain, heterokaryon incompatibility, protein kinase-like domain superfamily [Colletotrichum destructivum]|uniref:Protein kinase domain-containing protein n=1 Tax=Colletotrichum destructivum TaxID=34406 RepID=A0AAX4J1W5_9PEZI|nr:Putative protein kinase domain, heterokaryon incompatibility, protein kinase-like domain superfamily [Colletotrichum destructivum]